jgi:hypothetical protein
VGSLRYCRFVTCNNYVQGVRYANRAPLRPFQKKALLLLFKYQGVLVASMSVVCDVCRHVCVYVCKLCAVHDVCSQVFTYACACLLGVNVCLQMSKQYCSLLQSTSASAFQSSTGVSYRDDVCPSPSPLCLYPLSRRAILHWQTPEKAHWTCDH